MLQEEGSGVYPAGRGAFERLRIPDRDEFPDLEESFRMTAEEFKQKYRHTPVWRVKFRGFRRNLAIAMGNSRQKEFVPILEQSLDDETDKIVADSIRWALEELRSA
mgnify:CR=1 FL=1